MPGLDGTGPRGQGPMTGGGFGYCGGNTQRIGVRGHAGVPAYRGRFGGGAGRRAPGTGGRGRGNMNRFLATGIPGWQLSGQPQASKGDIETLKSEKANIERYLSQINERIKELEKQT